MKIKFLKAGTGDSILVQHQTHNIIIDGGNDSKYLLNEVDEIYKRSEVIDLLIITHHDDDHIKGIIDLLKYINECKYNDNLKFIKQVIFNSPRRVLNKMPEKEANLLSYKQAYEVEELLSSFVTDTEWTTYTDKSETLVFSGLEIAFLSPTEEDLKKYSLQKGAFLTGDFKCDWDSSMKKLEKYIDDRSLDKSIPNKSSVVLKLQFENKSTLLTGDVTPDRLDIILKKLSDDNKGKPVKFDFVKLPHHGSYRSLTESIIKNITCNTFIVSTNSRKHCLPNKRALLKILKHSNRINRQKINFIFNYEETINKLDISDKEKKEYNFLLTPNNKNYGISI